MDWLDDIIASLARASRRAAILSSSERNSAASDTASAAGAGLGMILVVVFTLALIAAPFITLFEVLTWLGHALLILESMYTEPTHKLWLWSGDGLPVVIASTAEHNLAYVNTIGWLPDGARFAAYHDDGTVSIWDADSHELIATQAVADGPFQGLWSPDGTSFASYDAGHIHLWDTTTWSKTHTLDTSLRYGSLHTLAWSPDGTSIAFSLGPRIRVYDVATREITHQFEGGAVQQLLWLPAGDQLVVRTDQLTIWKIALRPR